jgi:hypothetical protein
MKLTKKQLIALVDSLNNKIAQSRLSAGRLRSDIFKMNIDRDLKYDIISRIDKHIDELL